MSSSFSNINLIPVYYINFALVTYSFNDASNFDSDGDDLQQTQR